MKDRKNGFITHISIALMTIALCTQLPLACSADDSGGQTLYGAAKRHEQPDATAAQSPTQNLNASDNAATLQSEQAAPGVFTLAVQKLSKRQGLSAEEYRSLGIGTAGLEANQTFFQKTGQVSRVYKDSPADKAGIHVGEKLLLAEPDPDEARERANPTQPLFRIKFKKVGVPVDITLLRHRQPVKMTLITMNIEDIEEPEIRHMIEKMVSELNYPQEGTFSGPSIHDLSPTQ
jgi:hypothetical protein